MTSIVYHLGEDEEIHYTCSPREAVIAAYAQSLRDWNTWTYKEKYGHLVRETEKFYCLGDFSVAKEPTE